MGVPAQFFPYYDTSAFFNPLAFKILESICWNVWNLYVGNVGIYMLEILDSIFCKFFGNLYAGNQSLEIDLWKSISGKSMEIDENQWKLISGTIQPYTQKVTRIWFML